MYIKLTKEQYEQIQRDPQSCEYWSILHSWVMLEYEGYLVAEIPPKNEYKYVYIKLASHNWYSAVERE